MSQTPQQPQARPHANRRVALASFPRSGNTWLRHLIEEASGLPSGSVYQDRVMPRGPEGIVIKTHLLDRDRYDAAIHIVRNPVDAIFSHFRWKLDVAGEEVTWDSHVTREIEYWGQHTYHWLTAEMPVLRLRYEELRAGPVEVLASVMTFLGQKVAQTQLEEVVAGAGLEQMRARSPLGAAFFRKGAAGDGMQHFDRAQLTHLLDRLRPLLKLDELSYLEPLEAALGEMKD